MLSEGCSTLAEEDIERPILEVLAEHPGEARSFVLFAFWVLLDFGFLFFSLFGGSRSFFGLFQCYFSYQRKFRGRNFRVTDF